MVICSKPLAGPFHTDWLFNFNQKTSAKCEGFLADRKGFEPSIFSVTGRRVNRATPPVHTVTGKIVTYANFHGKGGVDGERREK